MTTNHWTPPWVRSSIGSAHYFSCQPIILRHVAVRPLQSSWTAIKHHKPLWIGNYIVIVSHESQPWTIINQNPPIQSSGTIMKNGHIGQPMRHIIFRDISEALQMQEYFEVRLGPVACTGRLDREAGHVYRYQSFMFSITSLHRSISMLTCCLVYRTRRLWFVSSTEGNLSAGGFMCM